MAGEQTIEVTEQDVESLESKLITFAETLPGGERALLLDLIDRVIAGDEGDVQGYCAPHRASGPVGTLGLKTVFFPPGKRRKYPRR